MRPMARLPRALVGNSQQHAEPHSQSNTTANGTLDLHERHPAQPGVSLVPEYARGALGEPR